MDRPDELGRLQTGDWGRIQNLADRFEQSWQQAHVTASTVDINTLLPGPGDPLRSAALYELIKIDMEFRWRRGQIITLDHYLEKYPELGPAENLSPLLVYEEYRLSQLHGVNTPLSVYQKRFPKQFEELQKLIQEGNQQTCVPTEPQVASKASSGLSGSGNTGGSGVPAPSPSGLASPLPLGGTYEGMIVGGGYKVQKRIGSGAFGEVWRATAPGGVEVAVKIIFRPLDNEEAKSELQAMELIKTLRHPFLLQTHAFWPEQDRLMIVMELADGSLRDRLKQCRKLGLSGIPVKELITYFREAAEALDYLHGKRLLHRDIKPDNILLSEHHAKVADFGLARLMSTRRSAKVTGSGTPAYMAPEMWASQVNQFSDQYCLATSYAELRLAKALFQGQDIIQLMRAHLQDMPDLSGLPPKERDVLLRALAKDPLKRFKSCGEFLEALEEVVETGKVVRRDVSHIPAGAVGKPVPAPHPGVVHDEWMDLGGTLRPGGVTMPVMPPGLDSRSGGPPGTDTDARDLPTMAGASDQALGLPSGPGRETATPAGSVSNRMPSWKDTAVPAPQSTSEAVAPRGPSWKKDTLRPKGRKKGVLLAAGALVAALALVGFMFWNAGSNLKAETAKLAEAGQFDQALTHIDQATFWALPFARASARDQVRDLWLGQVRRLQSSEKFDEGEKSAGELLQRFPDNDEAAELLNTALRHNIPPLIARGDFPGAYKRLSGASPQSKDRGKLLDDLHNKWLVQARKDLTAGAYSRAQETAQAMLAYFKNDPDADRVRRSARYEIVAVEVRKLKQAEKYDAAFTRLDEETRDLLPEDASRLKQEVEDDRRGKFKDALAKAEDDLAANKYDACLADLAVAEQKARGDSELAALRKLRIQAGSGPLAPLLQQADRQFKAGDFADCQETLRQGLDKLSAVNPQARKDVEQKLDTLLVLSWARDANRDDKRSDDILRRFTHLFDQEGAPRLTDLAKAYVDIAETHPRWRGQAQQLRGVVAKLPMADRGPIERKLELWGTPMAAQAFGELLTKARAQFDKGDYQGCLDQLRFDMALLTDATARNEYRALRALSAAALQRKDAGHLLREALDEGVTVRQEDLALALAKLALDQPDDRGRAVEILNKVLPGLPKTSTKDRAESYAAYLNGLAHREENKLEEAAKDMSRAYAVESEALLTPERSQQAAEILRIGAEALPAGAGPLSPFATPEGAGLAYQWLDKAQQLLARAQQELPVAARVKLALAANFKTEPDRKLALKLAERLVAQPGATQLGAAALPLLLVRAQAQDTPDAAITAYAQILKQFKKPDRDGVPAKLWFTSILQPAITLGDNLPDPGQKPPEVKAALAKCYAVYARFVREHLYDDEWIPKNPKQKAFDYYGKAVQMDDSRPEYWIGYAYSQTALAKVDWGEVEKDAHKALDLGPNNSAAHGLLGYVYLLQSRRDGETDRKKQLDELRQADQELDKALTLAKKDEEDKPTVLLNRSITDLELGNYLDHTNVAERKKYLYAARDFAEQASKLPHPYPEWVQEAWGNALEDIGMFLGEKAAYPDAIAKFGKAIDRRSYVARPWVSRGRTQYRWAVLGGNKEAKLLDSAMRDLVQAIALSKNSRDGAEAYYWQGKVYQELHKLPEARKAFAESIKVGEKYSGRDWAMLARQQNVQATLAEARALLRTRPEESIKQADEAARLVEQGKQGSGDKETARLLTNIYRLKADAGLQQAASSKGEAQAKALKTVQAAAAKIEENGDPAQGALLRGLTFEAQGEKQWPQAIQAYDEGLKASSEKADQIRGQLLINRATLQVKTEAKVSRDEMLKDLAAAVKLVPNAADKASALALASIVNTLEANAPGAANSQQSRKDAIKTGREAIKYAGDTHPDRAAMRYFLANNLLFLAKDTADDKRKLPYLNEAIERAREAKQMENLLEDDNWRAALRNLQMALQTEKTEVEARLNQAGSS